MKKFIGFVSVLATVSLLAGCGSQDAPLSAQAADTVSEAAKEIAEVTEAATEESSEVIETESGSDIHRCPWKRIDSEISKESCHTSWKLLR